MSAAATLLVQMARDSGRAVVTEFDLFLLARQLFRDRGYRGAKIPARNGSLDARGARKLLSEATFDLGYYPGEVPSHYLPRDPDFTSVLFTVGDGDATKVMFDADPFCYLSHASALAFHGMGADTSELHISTPMRGQWAGYSRHYMEAMLGDDLTPLMTSTNACSRSRNPSHIRKCRSAHYTLMNLAIRFHRQASILNARESVRPA